MEIVLFIAGLAFASVGGFVVWDFRNFKRHARVGEGRVIAYAVRQSHSRKGGTTETYAPVVQYDINGQQHQFTASVSSGQVKYEIGDMVSILIHNADSSRARMNNSATTIFGSVFLAIGLVLMVVFVSVFRFDVISLIIAAVIIMVLLYKLINVITRYNINSLDDLKAKLQSVTQPKPPEASPQERLISDSSAFKAHVRQRQAMPLWVLILLLIVGLGTSVGGVFLGKERVEFLRTAASGDGVVVGFSSSTSTSSDGTSTVYYPIVEYRPDVQGKRHESVRFKHDVGSSHSSYHRGDKVKVLYSRNNPDKAIIDNGWMNCLGPLLMVAFGVLFVMIAGMGIKRQRRQKQQG